MNLREAAERALDALEDIFGKEKKDVGAINALRQALAQPEKHLKFEGPIHVECQCDKCKAQPEKQQYITKVLPDGTFTTEPVAPVDNVYISEERVHKTEKSIHEDKNT